MSGHFPLIGSHKFYHLAKHFAQVDGNEYEFRRASQFHDAHGFYPQEAVVFAIIGCVAAGELCTASAIADAHEKIAGLDEAQDWQWLYNAAIPSRRFTPNDPVAIRMTGGGAYDDVHALQAYAIAPMPRDAEQSRIYETGLGRVLESMWHYFGNVPLMRIDGSCRDLYMNSSWCLAHQQQQELFLQVEDDFQRKLKISSSLAARRRLRAAGALAVAGAQPA